MKSQQMIGETTNIVFRMLSSFQVLFQAHFVAKSMTFLLL